MGFLPSTVFHLFSVHFATSDVFSLYHCIQQFHWIFFKSTFNKNKKISRYVHSNNNLRDVFGHSFFGPFFNDFAHRAPGKIPGRYLPNPHNSKDIPKHKLLVKHPGPIFQGALWSGILRYWLQSCSPPPSSEFVAGCFATGA